MAGVSAHVPSVHIRYQKSPVPNPNRLVSPMKEPSSPMHRRNNAPIAIQHAINAVDPMHTNAPNVQTISYSEMPPPPNHIAMALNTPTTEMY